MTIRLTAEVYVDGLMLGPGSEIDLSPEYAEALVSRGKAIPVRGAALEVADPPAMETAAPRRKRAR